MTVMPLEASMEGAEWQTRVELAACYRLIAHYGWDDLIFTHISARVPGPDDHFLINPFGTMFQEITASLLVKVDLDGNVISTRDEAINPAGFTTHSAVHAGRSDVGCVIHLHTDDGVGVSAQARGLLPLSQHALIALGAGVAYHDYEGFALDHEEREWLVADLGSASLMILRNHGTLACGPNVPAAFLICFHFERACAMQIRAQAGGGELILPSEAVRQSVRQSMAGGGERLADLAWPAALRMLDAKDPSYKH